MQKEQQFVEFGSCYFSMTLKLLTASMFVCFSALAQDEVKITSEGTVDARIPIAVPDVGTTPEMVRAATEMTNVIRYDLDFAGLFKLLPPQDIPDAFTGFSEDATQIDFSIWRDADVEYLVYAFVKAEGEELRAACRLFDAVGGTQVLGKLITTNKDHPRLAAHRFSEEIIRFLHGVPGVGSSQICFSAGVPGRKEIYIADYDGANAMQVTHHNSISIKPKLSPDGHRIAYLSYKDRYPFLYIFDRQTGKSTTFSKNVGLNAAPAWSPDGAKLALVLSKDGNTEIYMKNLDGTELKRLTENKVGDTSPTFSPDGKQIAFVSDRGGRTQIFAMDSDGNNVRRLSYQGGSAYDPVWSPDGRHIAYVVEKPGEGLEIYVMDATGENPRRLTDSHGSNESPSWSPDGRHIAFAGTRSGRSEV